MKPQLLPTRLDLLDVMPKGGTVAELGVFLGEFSAEILARTQPASLYLVDTWPERSITCGDKDGRNRITVTSLSPAWMELVGRYRDNPVVQIRRGTTQDVLRVHLDRTFDWVYVDASHDYANVIADLRMCLRLVRPGGFICGHDYHPRFPGVVKAVAELRRTGRVEFKYQTADGLPSYGLLVKEQS